MWPPSVRTIAATLVAAALLVALAAARQPGTDDRPADGPGIGFERPGWTPTRVDPLVTLHLRRTLGYLTIVPACTLFLLYVFRPKPYVLAWVVAWTAASGMLLAASFDLAELRLDLPDDRQSRLVTARFLVAAWAFYALAFAVFLRWGALWFRQPARLPAWAWWAAGASAAWLAASARWFGLAFEFVPAFVLMTLWLARGAIVYLRVFARHRFIGALLVGAGVAGITLTNVVSVGVAVARRAMDAPVARVAYFNILWSLAIILGMHLLAFEDLIDELRHANAELEKGRDEMRAMAVTDALTGCYNRRFLDDVARHELEQHRRYQLPLSLLFIDCDRFKTINDTLGHETGDRVLRTVGEVLRARTRESDYAFRWGGDEFLVLLSAGLEAARAKAEDVRRAFLASDVVRGLPEGVDLSIGCVAVPPGTTDLAPLIEEADREMYERKAARLHR